jgi:hypothetical protein
MKRASAHLAAAALFVVVAGAMLWPLPRLLGRAAVDRETSLINAWIYDWDHHATFHRNVPTFRADMPDHQYGIAVFAFPLRLFGAQPLLAHNILLWLGFAFTGYGAFVLMRVVTGSWWAGAAAGMVAAFAPWRFLHLDETRFAWAAWLPLMLAALVALGREPTPRRALLFGLALFMNGVTSVYWLVFGSIAIALTALILLVRKPRALLLFGAATLGAALLLIPWVLPYRFAPSLEFERPPFPGYVAALLALIGLVGPLGRDAFARQLILLTSIVWIVLGVAGSLGGFAFIPLDPIAWAMIGYTGLGLLAGIGAMKLVRNRNLVGLLIVALLGWELRPEAPQYELIDTDPLPVHRFLAETTERHERILELPMNNRPEYLFRSTVHHRRHVFDDEIRRAFDERPIGHAVIDRLKSMGVTRLVVHGDALRDATAPMHFFLLRGFDNGQLRFLGRFDHGVEGDFAFAFERGDLKPYFGPQPATRPFGWLDEPQPDAEVRGPVRVMGWALAPAGIRAVRVYVNNRAEHHDAQLFARPDVAAIYPWHDASRAGFTVDIPRFREGRTDVEVEIIDGTGKVARLPQRWFLWSR